MRTLKHLLELWALFAVMFFVNLLPRNAAVAFGRFVGRVGFKLWAFRRRVAKANLRLCFPGKDEAWVSAVARRSFETFGQMVVENMRFIRYNAADVRKRVRVENEATIYAAEQAGRGALLITGHYGSFELAGAALSSYGHRVTFVAAPQSNRFADAVMNRVRRRAGVRVILTGGPGVRAILKELRSGGIVAMLADQDAGADGVLVEFFGRPARAPRGPAEFALRTGACFCCGRVDDADSARYVIRMEDPVFPAPLGGTREEDIKYWTQVYIAHVEKWCRKRPGQYMWMHRRFKSTRPELYEELHD